MIVVLETCEMNLGMKEVTNFRQNWVKYFLLVWGEG